MDNISSDSNDVKDVNKNTVAPLKMEKTFVRVVIGITVLAVLIYAISTVIHQFKTAPLIYNFEGIKEMEEIEFVRQEYNEIVPVTSKEGHLEFLLTVPASISGKMDMTKINYTRNGDYTMNITLPDVIISDVIIDMNKINDFDTNRGSSIQIFLSGGGRDYGKVYSSIMESLEEVKKGVLASAIKDNIISETNRRARTYLASMARSIGYSVNFIESNHSKSLEKEIEKKLGGELWRKIKHKVKAIPKSTSLKKEVTATRSSQQDKKINPAKKSI